MVGEKLGSYIIEGTLGVGAMGVVYRARHETRDLVAAVKVVSKEIATRGNSFERFEREADILKQFRHKNIVQFYAVGRSKGTNYFAMEYVEGQTLDHALAERGAIPWKEVAELGIQLCEALQYAHDHGVVHRDLKPSNLMLTPNGTLKLTDFGIAKDLDATALTATGRTLGTAAYMAPEQIRGNPAVSHKTDLYSLGCVLYQMLAGCIPFDRGAIPAMMHAHLFDPPPRPSGKVVEIPRALDDLVLHLMAKDPPDRPWDATAVAEKLKTVRDKASRGETVAMVWPTSGRDAMSAEAVADAAKKKKTGKTRSRRRGDEAPEERIADTRRRLETIGLVTALLLIAGVIAYIVWPPGQEYLIRHAETLMASKDRHDWDSALKEYIEPLDQRFPDHPYKQKTADWRDKISLTAVEGRARVLQSQANTGFNKPSTPNEERFVAFHTIVAAAEKRYDDAAAMAAWDEMASQLRPTDKEDRPWSLLAASRSAQLKKDMEKRKTIVVDLMSRAVKAEQAGKVAEGTALRAEVVEKYGKYPDVAQLLGLAPGGDDTAPKPEKTPRPEPSTAPPAADVKAKDEN
jgi:eukaryotic-like serine/threonine-protein kinase